ncbi:MAG: hypothetical protein ACW98F_00460, partial [Candidatus Hodarchaeales archaeon]
MLLKTKTYLWGFSLFFGYLISNFLFLKMLNSLSSKVIQNSVTYDTTMIIGNIIPLIFTCLLIFYELNIFSFDNSSVLVVKPDNMIYIPRFETYVSIFECSSLSNIYTEGLSLLNGLNRYSIEILQDIQRLRVYFYSNSKTELFKNIEEAKPLLDTVFPNLRLLTTSSLKSDFLNYSLRKRGFYHHINQGTFLIIPKIEQNTNSQTPKKDTLILNFNSQLNSTGKSNVHDSTQCYSFTRFKENSFFEFFGEVIFTEENEFLDGEIDANLLCRAIIRYRLVGFHSFLDNDGLINIRKQLGKFKKVTNTLETPDMVIPPPPIIQSDSHHSKPLVTSHGYNQICKELCNISLSAEEDTIKTKKCKNRVSFCKKLLVNRNLTKFLGELIDGEDDKRKEVILSDLLRHVSFQQIYCL